MLHFCIVKKFFHKIYVAAMKTLRTLFGTIALFITLSAHAQFIDDCISAAFTLNTGTINCNVPCSQTAVLNIMGNPASPFGAPPYTYYVYLSAGGTNTEIASGSTPAGEYAFSTAIPGICLDAMYFVTVQNASGCFFTYTAIFNSGDISFAFANPTPASCSPGCDGSVFIDCSSPPPYTVSLNGIVYGIFTDYPLLTNLCSGDYTALITDGNGCSNELTFAISQLSELFVWLPETVTVPATLTPTVSGGTSPYSYLWNTGETTATINVSLPGNYSVTVTNASGCTTEATTVATGGGSDCSTLVVAATSSVTSVAVGESYQVFATATGGTPPYAFHWENAAYMSNPDIANPFVFPGDPSYATSVVQVTDANGCTASAYVVVWQEPGCDFTVSALPTPASCNGFCDGSVQLAFSGGTPPYVITLPDGSVITATTFAFINNLCPGTHLIYITDAAGCTSQIAFTIMPPPALLATPTASDATIAIGETTTLFANVTGGTPPYAYLWQPAGLLVSPTAANPQTLPLSSTTTFTLLATDANGCMVNGVVSVLVEGGGCTLTAITDVIPEVIAPGESAQIVASIFGGTPPYSYTWTPTMYLDNPSSPTPIATPPTTTTYQIIVADITGCTYTTTAVVVVDSGCAGFAAAATVEPFIVAPGTSAQIYSTVTGGTPPYTYLWQPDTFLSNPLSPYPIITPPYNTTLTLQVTDANGCLAQTTLEINTGTPAPLIAANDTVYMELNTTANIAPLLNDSGNGTLNLFSATTLPIHNLSIDYTADLITFTPQTGFLGEALISYILLDATGATATGQIVVIVQMPGECDICVWPGDADNNGTANNFDVLNIGLAYDYPGPERTDQSINWYGHAAADWPGAFPDGLNHKFADCNGNGTINAADTLAVSQNYGQTHGKNQSENTTGVPLYFVLEGGGSSLGEPLTVSVHLGDAENPATDFYGIAFSVLYDPTLIEPNTANYNADAATWAGTPVNTLKFGKDLYTNGQLDVAFTRIDHNNASGYGKIGEAHFVIIENIEGKNTDENSWDLPLNFANIRCIKNDGTEIEIAAQEAVVIITGIDNNSNPANTLKAPYPNPANHTITFTPPPAETATLQITNIAGSVVYNGTVSGNTTIDTSLWASGLYFANITGSKNRMVYKIMVQHQ